MSDWEDMGDEYWEEVPEPAKFDPNETLPVWPLTPAEQAALYGDPDGYISDLSQYCEIGVFTKILETENSSKYGKIIQLIDREKTIDPLQSLFNTAKTVYSNSRSGIDERSIRIQTRCRTLVAEIKNKIAKLNATEH